MNIKKMLLLLILAISPAITSATDLCDQISGTWLASDWMFSTNLNGVFCYYSGTLEGVNENGNVQLNTALSLTGSSTPMGRCIKNGIHQHLNGTCQKSQFELPQGGVCSVKGYVVDEKTMMLSYDCLDKNRFFQAHKIS